MKYEDKLFSKLREQVEPGWEDDQARRKAMGWNEITLDEQLDILFNQRVNCGGYALEVDGCIFPAYKGKFEEVVSGLLENMTFIRLLGDTELLEDEYLVIYRANSQGGHHFIKIQDGHVTEKNECHEIQEFNGWPNSLKHSPQAVFAVKKEHDIILKNQDGNPTTCLILDDILGKDFESMVESAILNGHTNFLYHQHEYHLEKNTKEKGRAFVYSDGRIIGEVMIDGDECIVAIKDEEKDYVSNTDPKNRECLEVLKSYEDIEL